MAILQRAKKFPASSHNVNVLAGSILCSRIHSYIYACIAPFQGQVVRAAYNKKRLLSCLDRPLEPVVLKRGGVSFPRRLSPWRASGGAWREKRATTPPRRKRQFLFRQNCLS